MPGRLQSVYPIFYGQVEMGGMTYLRLSESTSQHALPYRRTALVAFLLFLSNHVPGLMQAVRYNADRVTLLCSSTSFASAHSRRRT